MCKKEKERKNPTDVIYTYNQWHKCIERWSEGGDYNRLWKTLIEKWRWWCNRLLEKKNVFDYKIFSHKADNQLKSMYQSNIKWFVWLYTYSYISHRSAKRTCKTWLLLSNLTNGEEKKIFIWLIIQFSLLFFSSLIVKQNTRNCKTKMSYLSIYDDNTIWYSFFITIQIEIWSFSFIWLYHS